MSARDDRSKDEKLRAMAEQTASPKEAKVAQHILFKKYGAGWRHKTPTPKVYTGADRREPEVDEYGDRSGRVPDRRKGGSPILCPECGMDFPRDSHNPHVARNMHIRERHFRGFRRSENDTFTKKHQAFFDKEAASML